MTLIARLGELIDKNDQDILNSAVCVAENLRSRLVLVGGVVRDLLMGKKISDMDLMVDYPADPFVQALQRAWRGDLIMHERFLTYTLHHPSGRKLDVATAREETYGEPGRLPDVRPTTVENDLKRRDFTINAIAMWLSGPVQNTLLDPFSGEQDIKRGLIRALHEKSFEDDPTRIYRAARFAGRFHFAVAEKTQKDIHKAVRAGRPHRLTPVRRRHEFELILKEENPLPALLLLSRWNALSSFHPQFDFQLDETSLLAGRAGEDPGSRLTPRLRQWFQRWDGETAERIMTDLSFEKRIKKMVLSSGKF